MSRHTDSRRWLAECYDKDTLLAIELMVIFNGPQPELIALQECVERIYTLLAIHRCRLAGAAVGRQGRLWVLSVPGWHACVE